ncbi:MAG TPA: DNA-processing protein DprA [Candidatus Eremiobacteraeota bacterium]|nr:MAG: DNA recombination-mediator protein A [bacterium ADurb.Bin363]HPZ08875.1 DNA-processing protein DprA [Candidatus Eremiobacteraeota bacterium]
MDKITILHKGKTGYPEKVERYMLKNAPEKIYTLGNLDILNNNLTAIFCSLKCPGNIILQTCDMAQKFKKEGITVIGGFHSSVEKEVLTILLQGIQPIIICPARSLEGMRIKPEYKEPFQKGRIIFLSPFDKTQKRATTETALYRNHLVASLADRIIITFAEPDGKTEQLCKELIIRGKNVYTLKSEKNHNLIKIGLKYLSD